MNHGGTENTEERRRDIFPHLRAAVVHLVALPPRTQVPHWRGPFGVLPSSARGRCADTVCEAHLH